jgi:hypothetical protein
MLRITSTAILAGALTLTAADPALARVERCLPQIEEKLTELQIDRSTINRISVLPRRQPGRLSNTIIGYDATVSFKNCRGYLAIDMNRACGIQQVYARNQCRFPGVVTY